MRTLVQPKHPDWTAEVTPFDAGYIRLHHLSYLLPPAKQERLFFGEPEPRTCAFCNGDKATFKNESHLVPAALGNRGVFSLEECDDCNGRFGRACEDELARMLATYRALFSVPGRKRLPKHRPRSGGHAFVGGATKSNHVQIGVSDDDDSVTWTVDEELKVLTVKVKGATYRPRNALGALLRSFWMLLSKHERERNLGILEEVERIDSKAPFSFFRGFLPAANPNEVELEAWERTAEIDGSDTICRTRVGHLVLIWAAPRPRTTEYPPTLLPAFSAEHMRSLPTFRRCTTDADGVVFGGYDEVTFGFDHFEEVAPPE